MIAFLFFDLEIHLFYSCVHNIIKGCYKLQQYYHPLTNEKFGDWAYCLACFRAFATEKLRMNDWHCPYCGALAFDICSWDKNEYPLKNYPEHPDIPTEGARYLMEPSKHK